MIYGVTKEARNSIKKKGWIRPDGMYECPVHKIVGTKPCKLKH